MPYFHSLFLLDPLSLFFLAVIFLIGLPSAVYSAGYLKGEGSRLKITLAWILFFLFLISMAGVVVCGNLILFLAAWETMSLVSYFLVIFDTRHERSIRAGTVYIVMAHVATASLAVRTACLRWICWTF